MIERVDVLYPAVAMALLTLTLVLALGLRRFIAVRRRTVNHRYYETFSTAEGEPESLRRHTRNVQNLFEAPPLFYVALITIYVAGRVDHVILIAAWLYVALRLLHSCIHLSYNRVSHRFPVYGASMGVLAFLWIKLALSLAAST
jgi:hypothetical protein